MMEREIEDLAICFYGGEPLLKTRVIYKIMDMFPNARFCLQVHFLSGCLSLDERNAPQDRQGRLPHEDRHDSLLHRRSTGDHQSLSWFGYLRANYGECRVYQSEGLQPRLGGSHDGQRGATGRYLRGSYAYHNQTTAIRFLTNTPY